MPLTIHPRCFSSVLGALHGQIRSALRQGDVTSAIEMANDLNPETLDTSPRLFFRLQLQRLIEFIRDNKVTEALDFAESELAPLTDLHPDFLEELEETMALFAFEDQQASPLAHLLEPAQRHKVYIPTPTPCILMPPDTRLGQRALPVFGACVLGGPIRACNLRPSPK